MSTDAEIAWAAGLFEGEGTFCYSPNHVRGQLNMTDFEPVRNFHRIVGVGRLASKPARGGYKDQLVWRVTDRAGVEAVLCLLRPWLSDRRIEQAEDALRLQAEVIASNEARRDAFCRNGHPRTPENTYHYWHKQKNIAARFCRVCSRESTRASREASKSRSPASKSVEERDPA